MAIAIFIEIIFSLLAMHIACVRDEKKLQTPIVEGLQQLFQFDIRKILAITKAGNRTEAF